MAKGDWLHSLGVAHQEERYFKMPLYFYKPTRHKSGGGMAKGVQADVGNKHGQIDFPLPRAKADGLYFCVQETLQSSSVTSVTLQNMLPQSATNKPF